MRLLYRNELLGLKFYSNRRSHFLREMASSILANFALWQNQEQKSAI